ncbi:hypothetical protein QZH41_000821 [Actinostola sp. cb2023]|nr:hypothetical protein QZH41_000821 [Actinostola sp. cb2023]
MPKLVIVFRRLARSVLSRPILFGHVKSVVDKALQRLLTNPEEDFQAVQNAIHKQITELESNQDAMHTLQTAGYNQGSLDEDLWDSSSIHMSSYVPKVESIEAFRIQRLLKQMWREWRSILVDLDIKEVEVNGENVKTTELMNHSDSLEIMESQLEAVKKATQNAPPNHWSSNRRRQLMQKERNVRKTITEEVKQVGCYAPNGFHSEKPVICGLSADNKILTLYKQEKGNTLTELEDVEVKLFPVGMLVFGVFSSSHSYDTDQLWAAFFKMLLLKRLVPKIFITNVSPGFEWIKTFVEPELSTPRGVTFCQCNSLIPTREDSFDYEPNMAIHGLGTDTQMEELIILTPENVKPVEFPNLQSPNRDKIIREWMDSVRQSIQNESRLHEVHPESQDKILKRLMFAIRKSVEISVDGDELTEETISSFIDMKKLSSGCVDSLKVQSNGEAFYCRLILDALQTEIAGNREWNTAFECCEHVEFLKLDSTATERNE